MENVKRCYFCDTPYQVFVCIHIELHEKNNADIYILDRYDSSEEVANNLRNTNLFRRVIWLKEESIYRTRKTLKSNIAIRKEAFFSYLRINKIVPKIIDVDVVYNEMFFPCHILCFRLVRFFYIKEKYPTDFFMYDEGIGSYRGQFEHSSIINTILKRVLFGKKAANMSFVTYLFRPELLVGSKDYELKRICPIDKIDFANHYLYCTSLKNGNNSYSDRRVFFFDAPREEIFTNDRAMSAMNNWYKIIEEKLGASNIIVKPHPRAAQNYCYGDEVDIYDESNAPIEIDYLKCDLDNMIFVSFMSTAVITPKLLFDKEPIVLLLCFLNEEYYRLSDKQIIFYEKIYDLYEDKNRFFMPKNVKELSSALQIISNL